MTTQRALIVQEIGKPLVLVHDRLISEAGPDQVQIKVAVAGKSETRRNVTALLISRLLPVALILIEYNRTESP